MRNIRKRLFPTRDGLFLSSKAFFISENASKLRAFIKKELNKEFILYPSIGFSAILTYKYLYPKSNISLYGYDFNNDTGWFWDSKHKHEKMTHNFMYEKEFLQNNPVFTDVIIH